ncbi:GNAT family N-acetyltransferase [Peribacillus deserti]|uniref:GCN5-related N-acetyltransferase Rv2170-like domain-containing protein n=1 Tax=Peribacillus deserti TaxID=673318 RepID=A0A2N5M8I6_9BACI|nr:GNAT family N-acetyltransferase [Peribacillus deserti]PLT30674.1 hypothetical protein CUU66_06575 [Peribacillus deserti]
MEFKVYRDINEFFDKTKPFYLADEAVHNLPYGILNRMIQGVSQNGDELPFMALIESEGEVILSFLQTPPHNMIISSNKSIDPELLHFAAGELISEGVSLPGVIGSKELAESFAAVWGERTGSRQQIEMNQRIYKLEKVNSIPKPIGRFAPAEHSHIPLILVWAKEFCKETGVLYEEARMQTSVRESFAAKSTFVWLDTDGHPVTMAKAGRKIENGTVVTLVYTPLELRGKGYASACVGELSREILKTSQFCCLYTDLANPVSNSIYMKIGYEPICDSIALKFLR